MHTWHIHLALKRKQPSGELAALFSASSERSTTSSRTTCQGELNSVLTLAITEDSMELWKQYRSFSRDVTELISAMLVHIPVTCFSKKYMQTESKVIILLSSQSKIMASEEKKNSVWSWQCCSKIVFTWRHRINFRHVGAHPSHVFQ